MFSYIAHIDHLHHTTLMCVTTAVQGADPGKTLAAKAVRVTSLCWYSNKQDSWENYCAPLVFCLNVSQLIKLELTFLWVY